MSLKRAAGAMAVCGLAAAASGQSVTVTFSADRSTPSVGEIITWTVSASFTGFDDPTAYFGGFTGSFTAAFPDTLEVVSFTNGLFGSGTAPVIDGGSINNINIFNSALLGTNDPAVGDFFTFETRVLDITPASFPFSGFGAVGEVSVFPSDFIFEQPFQTTTFTVITDGVVPSPAGGAVFAVSGLVVLARRRRGVGITG